MPVKPFAVIAVTAAIALGVGCGSDSTGDGVDSAGTQADQVVESLSPEARELLRRAEELAGRTARTGREYATGDTPPSVASQRLEDYATQGERLTEDVRDLPESDPARERIMKLSVQLTDTARELRAQAGTGKAPDPSALDDLLSGLQTEGEGVYDRYRDRLPAEARDEIGKAVDELAGR